MITKDALLAPSTGILVSPSRELQPAPLFTPTPKAAKRVLEFFTAQINNGHTRKAYLNATRRFAEWCGEFSPPTVKQSLAALRMLFDWLVTGHVLDVNPAHAVRGPKYVVKKGKTPVLTAEEARELLDSIKTVRKTKSQDGTESEQPSLVGLRDRALIGVMVYTFARVGAVLQMKVRDYFVEGRRGWVRPARERRQGAGGSLSPQSGAVPRRNTSPPPASREIRTRLCSRRRWAKRARAPARPSGSRTPTA